MAEKTERVTIEMETVEDHGERWGVGFVVNGEPFAAYEQEGDENERAIYASALLMGYVDGIAAVGKTAAIVMEGFPYVTVRVPDGFAIETQEGEVVGEFDNWADVNDRLYELAPHEADVGG